MLFRPLRRVNLYATSAVTPSTGKVSPGDVGNESSADERNPVQAVNASADRRTKKSRNFLFCELGHIGQPSDRLLLNTCPRPNQIEGTDGANVAGCGLFDVRVVVHADVAFLFQNGIFLGAVTQQFLINVLVVLAQPHWAAANL